MWLRRLRREHDNFAVALGWSEAAADGAEASLELSAGLHLFWFKHGHLNEARRWLKPALARPASETPEVKSLTAECWCALGLSTILIGSADEGRHYLETSLRLARELGDDGLAVVVLRMFVQGLVDAGEIEAAETCAAEALAIAEDAPTLAWNLEIFGRALAAAGYGLTASRVWGAAEVVYERIGLTTPRYWVTAYERALSVARAAVGDEAAFTAAWQEGRRMTPAEAVACAIDAATRLA